LDKALQAVYVAMATIRLHDRAVQFISVSWSTREEVLLMFFVLRHDMVQEVRLPKAKETRCESKPIDEKETQWLNLKSQPVFSHEKTFKYFFLKLIKSPL